MLELKECCTVPFPETLFEAYEIQENTIFANINTSKVADMMKHFIQLHNEPIFFILELPRRMDVGGIGVKSFIDNNGENDVYFIDYLTTEAAIDCLNALSPFLLKDGMNSFGFGCHESHEEILFGKYNVMTLYTKNAASYHSFFKHFAIEQTDHLVTAWDTFDAQHPGTCERYLSKESGKTIYDIPELYKEYGMYRYEASNEDAEITFDDLIGKVILVGLSYYAQDNELIEQKQFYGTVVQANEDSIRIKQNDGAVVTLPPDLRSIKRAPKGEYTLHSTGEVVIDPDFLSTWNITKDQ